MAILRLTLCRTFRRPTFMKRHRDLGKGKRAPNIGPEGKGICDDELEPIAALVQPPWRYWG